MEKIRRQFKVDYSLDWEFEVEISKIRKDLDEIEKLGATHVLIEANVFYDCAQIEIEAVSDRFETEEECRERIAKNKEIEHDIIRKEMEQLYFLQQKYCG